MLPTLQPVAAQTSPQQTLPLRFTSSCRKPQAQGTGWHEWVLQGAPAGAGAVTPPQDQAVPRARPPRSAGTLAASDIAVLGPRPSRSGTTTEGPGSPTSSSGSRTTTHPSSSKDSMRQGHRPRHTLPRAGHFCWLVTAHSTAPGVLGPQGQLTPKAKCRQRLPLSLARAKADTSTVEGSPATTARQQTLELGARPRERAREWGQGEGHQEQRQAEATQGTNPSNAKACKMRPSLLHPAQPASRLHIEGAAVRPRPALHGPWPRNVWSPRGPHTG